MARKQPPANQGKRGGISGPAVIVTIVSILIVIAVVLAIRHSYAASVPVAAPAATPAPQGTPLIQGTTVGKRVFPDGDTGSGGRGQTVDGVACNLQEMLAEHDHVHLTLFFNGKQVAVPEYVGIVQKPNAQGCLYWLHTHDATGIIHIESPQPDGAFTLGDFFDIWGRELAPDDVAGHIGPVHAFVDGMAYHGNFRAIPFAQHEEITLEVGKPVVTPPLYVFPPGV
ncbi:MAG TPA: hypothetical protein VNJ51_07670 [Candidatus Dormibacteraeota bacterium]|nr:hypothetical protein [Candidatus Dormibacteraeota bacterium]